ncbi:hypothetical protein TSUD_107380 [Trifolium subterraneum]|uniref:Uncharacterized protein n=1 Tax=Trifolium subterraneum TaxID=3900 RepID=A0A2Z6NPB6_TRISU|nr:hypothetical protein TSUD_107380 [Trifolium subterraneum]
MLPQGYFTTVLIPNQIYGELPTEFVQKHYHALPNEVQLWDINGMQHYLKLNKDHIVPHLTDGWLDVMDHYHVDRVKQIGFVYLGSDKFWVAVGNPLNSTDDYPSFHSHSTKPNVTNYFDVALSHYTSKSSQLVTNVPY